MCCSARPRRRRSTPSGTSRATRQTTARTRRSRCRRCCTAGPPSTRTPSGRRGPRRAASLGGCSARRRCPRAAGPSASTARTARSSSEDRPATCRRRTTRRRAACRVSAAAPFASSPLSSCCTDNISGSTSAPPAGPMQGHYPADAPCPRNVVANWIGPWPGIWWDHSAEWLGNQSLEFFSAYKAAGGELDEIVLDTELDGFETFSVAVSFHRSFLPSLPRRTLSGGQSCRTTSRAAATAPSSACAPAGEQSKPTLAGPPSTTS